MTGRTKTEIAIDCVERFSSAPRVIKISFVLTNLAFLLVIVGFATSGWVYITRSGQKASDKQGLFNHCAVAGIFTCCQSLNSYLSDNDVESVPAWFQFTRAIVGMGVTTSFIATVILYMHSFGDFDFLRRPYSIISYISGVFLLLGALVYGVMFGKDNWQRLATIHGSYGVTPFAGVLFLVAGFVTHCLDNPNQVEDLSIAQTNGRQLNVVVHPWQTQTPIGANQQGNGQPDCHTVGYVAPVVDRSQDWVLEFGSETDDCTILRFSRKIDTCDSDDIKITDDTAKIIFSYHPDDPVSMTSLPWHGTTRRGTQSLMLLATTLSEEASGMPENVITHDFLNQHYRIPPVPTTYRCTTFDFPDLGKKHHVVKVEANIQEGHTPYVHHMLLYHCANISLSLANSTYMCYDNAPAAFVNCRAVFAAWEIGGGELWTLPASG